MRWDRPLARLRTVLVNGFLQSRMVAREWKPGVMHAVIFLGFMTLLARKVQLLVIGYDETFVYPGLAGGVFAALQGSASSSRCLPPSATPSGGGSCRSPPASSATARRS